MMNLECCLFDLDGTLLNTATEMLAVINQVLAQENREYINYEVVNKFMAVGSMDFIQDIYPSATAIELLEKKKLFLFSYINYVKNTTNYDFPKVYPGITNLLMFLKEKNIPWGIVTNRPRVLTTHLISQNNLLKNNSIIICPEDVSKQKPNPEGLLIACKFMGSVPENCIYIGDHINDIKAGNLVNMFTVAASYGYISTNDNPYNWKADLCIKHPQELILFFQTNNVFM